MTLRCCFFGSKSTKKTNTQTKIISLDEEPKSSVISSIPDQSNFVKVDFEDVRFTKKIGSGSASTVYLAYWNEKEIAIKRFKKLNNDYIDEKNIITKLRQCDTLNQYIVQYYGFIENKTGCYLLMEYMPKGDLSNYIFDASALSLVDTLTVAHHVAQGLKNLHQYKYIHCDIKPENILLTNDLCAKITDFDSSIPYNIETYTLHGTLGYLAPELLKASQDNIVPYSEKSDVYAFGMTFAEMINHESNYSDNEPKEEIDHAVVENNLRPRISDSCPVSIKNLLNLTWLEAPASRVSFTKIIEVIDVERNTMKLS